MSEKQTRQDIIDKRLAEAGWNLNDPSQVTAEHPVLHQSSSSTGVGYSDYVLFERSGKPIAVVEAKRTTVEAEKGKEQAKQYADGIEKMGFARPYIFYTNGYDIYFWDDKRYPPRKVYGFFTSDDLERLAFQDQERQPLSSSLIDTRIAGRPYQIEGIRRILESINRNQRKALLVMATGTGKTRTAMALIDVMMRANWVKRVLFLADRNALLRQARDAFKEHLPNAPYTKISGGTCSPDKRVYLATYPSMHNTYPKISPGFFDLVIADESHRSIYKRYKEIFDHFDSFQLGLTATPIDYIERDTFKMFSCEKGMPTFNYSYEEAVNNKPSFLVDFKVLSIQSRFQIEGIKSGQLPLPIQKKLVEEGKDLEEIDFEGTDIEKRVTNSGTNEVIVREFMEQSIKDASGTQPGKSIIFAISHAHAMRLQKIFDQLYPEHKGRLARVIDSHDPRANTEGGLLDQFKDPKDPMKVAISVDMLDTGVDIPEVVNLVFAKPVFSRAKFWQMIGRGTRLCPDLFGPGKDKQEFLIIDHWNNFAFFNLKPEGKKPSSSTSIPEQLFAAKLGVAESALKSGDSGALNSIIKELQADIAALPSGSVTVKEKAEKVSIAAEPTAWYGFSQKNIDQLRKNMLPLMRSRSTEDFEAMKFDIDVNRCAASLISADSEGMALAQERILEQVDALPLTLNQVKAKDETIRRVKSKAFWKNLSFDDLEAIRKELRSLMKHKQSAGRDIEELDLEDMTLVKNYLEFGPDMEHIAVMDYRKKVEAKIRELMDQNEVLQKLRAGSEIDDFDIKQLADILRSEDPYVTEELLRRVYDNRTARFIDFIRHILGLEKLKTRTEAITEAFEAFIAKHNDFSADQIQFLQILKTFILDRGYIERKDLIDRPFTNLHPQGIRGLFSSQVIDEILEFAKKIGQKAA